MGVDMAYLGSLDYAKLRGAKQIWILSLVQQWGNLCRSDKRYEGWEPNPAMPSEEGDDSNRYDTELTTDN